ncbi:lachesin-like isoform X2 [Homarus americanus]|uniref:lachesin-like isoform X2 n=1 Tax=Homarus americanus TaxID=6706 RepID=UPI001C486DA1|nr:lachesin-like isoform X2 [Homarus americanus]
MFSKPILCYMISRLLLTGVSLAAGQQEVQHSDPSPPPRRDMYEAAEDMWVKVLSLNTLAPEFLGQNNTEVEAQVGGEASFSCYTYHLSDEMVAWLKRDDDQLLTVGQQVYASETRFSVVHADHMEAWELWVKEVQLTDAGQYECQLTTNPPVSFFFSLVVTQAEAVVAGPSEVHIEEGSHLALDCYVQNAPLPPVYIFWYHNNTMVNYGRLEALQVEHHNYTSSLVVSHVRPSHAGTYTCDPHLATPANVTVHVVTDKRPAAMHHGRSQSEDNSSGSTGVCHQDPAPMLFCVMVVFLTAYFSTGPSTASLH